MDTGALLLRQIVSAPADDTVRLAYADWLDEQEPPRVSCPDCLGRGWTQNYFANQFKCHDCDGCGTVPDTSDRDRAEFIRAQVELAKYPAGPQPFETYRAMVEAGMRPLKYDEAMTAVEDQVRILHLHLDSLAASLLAHYGRAWTTAIVPPSCAYSAPYDCDPHDGVVDAPNHGWATADSGFVGRAAIRFRRGFPWKLYCWWDHWRAHADHFRATTITHVALTTVPTYFYESNGSWHDTDALFTIDFVRTHLSQRLSDRYPGIKFELT